MTAVLFKFQYPDGKPLAGVPFTVSLNKPTFDEQAGTGILIPGTVQGITDALGTCTLNLVSGFGTYYLSLVPPDAEDVGSCAPGVHYRFVVPDSDALIPVEDLIVTGPTWSRPWDEQALAIIIEAKLSAQDSRDRAETAATQAASSAGSATGSADAAAKSATAAKTSETNANNSRTAAATSATNAKTSETNAKTSETNAASSRTAAATSATASAASATAAKTSETNAANSATASATSATSATGSATAAGNSATAAKTSETNSKTSETNAKTSETAAGRSATTATTEANRSKTEADRAENATSGKVDRAAALVTDPNAVGAPGGFTYTAAGNVNNPPALNVGYMIINIPGAGTASFQIASPLTSVAANKGRLWARQSFAGVWSTWDEVLNTNSLSLLYGIGGVSPAIADLDNLYGAGVYRTTGTAIGSPSASAGLVQQMQYGGAGQASAQLYLTTSTNPQMFFRSKTTTSPYSAWLNVPTAADLSAALLGSFAWSDGSNFIANPGFKDNGPLPTNVTYYDAAANQVPANCPVQRVGSLVGPALGQLIQARFEMTSGANFYRTNPGETLDLSIWMNVTGNLTTGNNTARLVISEYNFTGGTLNANTRALSYDNALGGWQNLVGSVVLRPDTYRVAIGVWNETTMPTGGTIWFGEPVVNRRSAGVTAAIANIDQRLNFFGLGLTEAQQSQVSTDLDVTIIPSTYRVASGVANKPGTLGGTLDVIKSYANTIVQRFTESGNGNFAVRSTANSGVTWSAWAIYIKAADIGTLVARAGANGDITSLTAVTSITSSVTLGQSLKLAVYTLTTLPPAAANNRGLIEVSNAAGGAKICRSNGTVWQIINTTTQVS